MSEQINKQNKLEHLQFLADKHSDLKKTITIMLDDLDKIELEFKKVQLEIKEK